MNLGAIRKVRSLIILSLDLIAVLSIFSAMYFIRLSRFPDYFSPDLWLITLTFIVTLYLAGTYFKEKSHLLPTLPIQTFFICLIGGIICIVWVYLLGPEQFNSYFGRGVLPIGTILFGLASTLIRFGVNSFYHLQEKGLELLYLGYSPSCNAFLHEQTNHSEVRSITVLSKEKINTTFANTKIIQSNLNENILKQRWQTIIIDPQHRPDEKQTSLLVSQRLNGTPVLSLADYYESNWFMVPVNHIGDDWFLRSQGFSMLANQISLRVKRLVDLVLSIAGILISAPIILICAIAIKLTSKGPIFFTQQRVGLNGSNFTIFKLRTMHVDAEEKGAQWAQENDDRVTLVGRFLRTSRLDELPQFWNVLRADMSFVGPRPERPEFTTDLAKSIPYYDLRHIVKPGITGWAQVIFPYGASEEDAMKKLQYELYYIKNQSLLLDLNIILRTLFTVFQRAGR